MVLYSAGVAADHSSISSHPTMSSAATLCTPPAHQVAFDAGGADSGADDNYVESTHAQTPSRRHAGLMPFWDGEAAGDRDSLSSVRRPDVASSSDGFLRTATSAWLLEPTTVVVGSSPSAAASAAATRAATPRRRLFRTADHGGLSSADDDDHSDASTGSDVDSAAGRTAGGSLRPVGPLETTLPVQSDNPAGALLIPVELYLDRLEKEGPSNGTLARLAALNVHIPRQAQPNLEALTAVRVVLDLLASTSTLPLPRVRFQPDEQSWVCLPDLAAVQDAPTPECTPLLTLVDMIAFCTRSAQPSEGPEPARARRGKETPQA